MLNLYIFEIRENLYGNNIINIGDVHNDISQVDYQVRNHNLCIQPYTTDTIATDIDTAKTNTELSEQ